MLQPLLVSLHRRQTACSPFAVRRHDKARSPTCQPQTIKKNGAHETQQESYLFRLNTSTRTRRTAAPTKQGRRPSDAAAVQSVCCCVGLSRQIWLDVISSASRVSAVDADQEAQQITPNTRSTRNVTTYVVTMRLPLAREEAVRVRPAASPAELHEAARALRQPTPALVADALLKHAKKNGRNGGEDGA